MINYLKGDILKCVTEGIIVHGVNCQGVMNSGVAKVIRAKYPGVFDQYVEDIENGCSLGDVSYFLAKDGKLNTDCLLIASAFTQEFYGREKGKVYVSYVDVYDALNAIFRFASVEDIKTVSMPLIGAGLGGASWDIIQAIIRATAEDNNYPLDQIFVYEL